MSKVKNTNAPNLEGWLIAAGAGVVAFGVAVVVGEFNLMPAAFIAALIFLVVGLVLGMTWGAAVPNLGAGADRDAADGMTKAAAAPVTETPAVSAVSLPVAQAEARLADPVVSAPAPAAPAPAAPAATPAEPTTPAMVAAAAPASAFVAVTPEAVVPPPAPKAAAKPKAVAKPKAAVAAPAPKVEAKAKAKAKAAPKAKAASDVAAPEAPAKAPRAKKADGPVRLKAARKGVADDLKEIEGIGPALEKLCNEMGFFHFDQIAGWSDADVAWVDQNMKTFKGRIVRDKWVAQAKLIVTEGLDAFRIRAKTNDY